MAHEDSDRLLDEYEVRVEQQTRRMKAARNEGEGSIWRYLGLLGMVGWSIVVPMALGALIGWWMDTRWQGGDTWTLILLLLGLVVGCVNAWRTITSERD